MSKYEFSRRVLTCQELSLGPIRWSSTSLREATELDTDTEQKLQPLRARVQALIQQAQSEGCSVQELHTILSQHTLGDHHGDA